jgi:hypothetical protein
MYSVAMVQRPGVRCKSCGKGVEIDDEYILGIPGAELAASLYTPFRKHFSEPVEGKVVDPAIRPWQETLTCANPDCGKTHTYRTDDLRLYDS